MPILDNRLSGRVGDAFRRIRIVYGLSQEQFGEFVLKLDRLRVLRLERRSNLTLDLLQVYAYRMGLTASQLVRIIEDEEDHAAIAGYLAANEKDGVVQQIREKLVQVVALKGTRKRKRGDEESDADDVTDDDVDAQSASPSIGGRLSSHLGGHSGPRDEPRDIETRRAEAHKEAS